ncbi:hypothetical protein BC332_14683 [Capsicum chinense]|nr:hypothetical protein BC332_14683 [Capsicum chinense]
MEQRGVRSGFRFHPTDTEGLTFLQKFMAKQEMNDSGFISTNIDVYDSEEEPWKIYSRGVPCGVADDSLYRYFITKKSSNLGNWKLQDEGKPVHRDSSSSTVVIVCKKKICYMINNIEEHREDDGHYWLMKEYELSNFILHQFDDDRRDYVLVLSRRSLLRIVFRRQKMFLRNLEQSKSIHNNTSNPNRNLILKIRPKRALGEGVMVNLSPSRKVPSFLSLAHRGEGLNDDGKFAVRLCDGGALRSGPNSHSSNSSEPPR